MSKTRLHTQGRPGAFALVLLGEGGGGKATNTRSASASLLLTHTTRSQPWRLPPKVGHRGHLERPARDMLHPAVYKTKRALLSTAMHLQARLPILLCLCCRESQVTLMLKIGKTLAPTQTVQRAGYPVDLLVSTMTTRVHLPS